MRSKPTELHGQNPPSRYRASADKSTFLNKLILKAHLSAAALAEAEKTQITRRILL
jgi:hypothetical protein